MSGSESGLNSGLNNRAIFILLLIIFTLFQLDPRPLSSLIPSYSLIRHLLITGMLFATVLYISSTSSSRIGLVSWQKILVIFCFLQFISSFWSSSPFEGIFYSVSVMIGVISAFKIGSELALSKITKCYVYSSLLCASVGALFVILFPQISTETTFLNNGDWKGLANQKNLFGYFSAISAAICTVRFIVPSYRHQFGISFTEALLFLPLFLLCIYMSDSRGAQIIYVILVSVPLFLQIPVNKKELAIFYFLLVVTAVIATAMTITVKGSSFEVWGAEISTSNRITLWLFGITESSEDIIFGVGRSGFWSESKAELFYSSYGWVLENFHNSYVTIFIENGLVGLILFVTTITSCGVYLYRSINTSSNGGVFICLAFLAAFIFYNFVEAIVGRTLTLAFFLPILILSTVHSSVQITKDSVFKK